MSLYPFAVREPSGAPAPLVVDSPHSGSCYPDDFDFECSLTMLRQTEDSYVDELVSGPAAEAGAIVLTASFPRSYIDVNRAENDIDPALLVEPWPQPLSPSSRTLLGLGLVRRLCKSGVPVYRGPLTVAEVQRRIRDYYRPYHAALERAVSRRVEEFGEGYLINCHSMPGRGGDHSFAHRPDMVLGDRNGEGCDPAFTRRVRDLLQEQGYSVALNDPYKGVEIVRRYGQPAQNRHALQLEINRRLYMNEDTLEKNSGFARLQADLGFFFRALADELRNLIPDQIAAE